jgi:hypothetical protein
MVSMLPTWDQVELWLFTLVCAGVGAYAGAYLKKKGENLATKDDFKDLKFQTMELRKATKKIESNIENRVWGEQRQWELSRDTLLVTMTALRKAHNAVNALYSAYGGDMKVKDAQWKERILDETKHCSDLLADFDEKRFAASLVCSKVVNSAVNSPAQVMRVCIIRAANGDFKKGSDLIPRLGDAVNLAIDFMRYELGVTPLSSESSEVPSLALLNRLIASSDRHKDHHDSPPQD